MCLFIKMFFLKTYRAYCLATIITFWLYMLNKLYYKHYISVGRSGMGVRTKSSHCKEADCKSTMFGTTKLSIQS